VPGSIILLATATLLANNVHGALRPSAGTAEVSRLAKLMVPVVALVAVYFTVRGGATIVALLLMGYSFVTQLFLALALSLLRRNPATKQGAGTGIVALVVNVLVLVAGRQPTLASRRHARRRKCDR
jgi:SSS family solute:Na+ symporter